MAAEGGFDIAALGYDFFAIGAGTRDQRFDQPGRDTLAADLGRDQRVIGGEDYRSAGKSAARAHRCQRPLRDIRRHGARHGG